MKVLLDHLMQESGEERKFGHPPKIFCDSPCQLSTLVSEIFSKTMTSIANLLVDTHRFCLNNEIIDKMILLYVSKIFMERVRIKNAFSSAIFGNVLSDESENVYFVIIDFVLVTIDVICYCSFIFAYRIKTHQGRSTRFG